MGGEPQSAGAGADAVRQQARPGDDVVQLELDLVAIAVAPHPPEHEEVGLDQPPLRDVQLRRGRRMLRHRGAWQSGETTAAGEVGLDHRGHVHRQALARERDDRHGDRRGHALGDLYRQLRVRGHRDEQAEKQGGQEAT